MIVVDTDLVAYAVLQGERTPDALRLGDRTLYRAVPALGVNGPGVGAEFVFVAAGL